MDTAFVVGNEETDFRKLETGLETFKYPCMFYPTIFEFATYKLRDSILFHTFVSKLMNRFMGSQRWEGNR